MKSRLLFLMCLLGVNLLFGGCAVFLLGAGAAGGYAISKDEVEMHADVPPHKAFSETYSLFMKKGAVTLANEEQGKVDALIEESEVKATIEKVTDRTIRLRIQARKTKGLFPNIDLANKLVTELIRKLK
ncbi:MAG: hypothetical protein HYS55_00735 [Candidatus Omnitrophica bacterium]|nr:hypothetical protein [Candidatus Omnitrophota bacterium]